MTSTRRDVTAAGLTALAVAVYFTTHEGWNVWLVGGSHRWAAGVITVLGMATCAQSSREAGTDSRILSVLGSMALVLAVVAIASGSLTPLSLLVLVMVLLWGASTLRHVQRRQVQRHRPHHVLH
jgi:hypothetical protein